MNSTSVSKPTLFVDTDCVININMVQSTPSTPPSIRPVVSGTFGTFSRFTEKCESSNSPGSVDIHTPSKSCKRFGEYDVGTKSTPLTKPAGFFFI